MANGFDQPITSDELLARFAFQESRYRRTSDGLVPHQRLFMPETNPENNSLETSVVRHLTYEEDEIWRFGQYIASLRVNGQLHGRADLRAGVVGTMNLNVIPDGDANIPSHALIVGWPSGREDKIDIALNFAQAAGKFIMAP